MYSCLSRGHLLSITMSKLLEQVALLNCTTLWISSYTVLMLHLWLVITKFFMDHLAAYKGGYDEQSWTTHDTYLDLALTPAKPWVSPVISMYFCIKAIISACGVRDTSCDQRLYYSCERGLVNAHNPFVRLWFCRLVFHVHTCLLDLEWRV